LVLLFGDTGAVALWWMRCHGKERGLCGQAAGRCWPVLWLGRRRSKIVVYECLINRKLIVSLVVQQRHGTPKSTFLCCAFCEDFTILILTVVKPCPNHRPVMYGQAEPVPRRDTQKESHDVVVLVVDSKVFL
jgi:hypothetical protein